MKKTVTVETSVCDFCGKEHTYHRCFVCGKDVCVICSDGKLVKYDDRAYSRGIDGVYCLECDAKMADDPLHQAFVKLKRLKDERNGFSTRWDREAKEAENTIEKLMKEREKKR